MRDFLNILLALGALQGFITSILLFTYKQRSHANRLLAYITLIISLACLNLYFLETIVNPGPVWKVLAAVIPLIILMPLGPLVFFYVKALINPEFKLGKKNRAHFYTLLIDLFPYITSAIFLIGGYWSVSDDGSMPGWQQFIDIYFVYSDIPRWLSLAIYLWLTQKLISKYKQGSVPHHNLQWVKRFSLGFMVFSLIWLLHLVPYLMPTLSDQLLSTMGWYPVYLPMIILIYWLGISGFLVSLRSYKNKAHGNVLPEQIIAQAKAKLTKAMVEDELYLNPRLKLEDVVSHCNLTQKTVSAVLNQHLNQSFNEYINAYRIEACKVSLLMGNRQLTITGIALECGFNSQATFQRAFKKATGLSPKQYLEQQGKSS